MFNADYYIENLGLQPHPEGGYFREVYRSGDIIPDTVLGEEYAGDRNLSTSIYFLLKETQISSFHRLKSDELWHYHAGSSVIIYCISPEGELVNYKLGIDLVNGDKPQCIIPRGTWFAAELSDKSAFSLFGCTVSPGFDFRDFELADRSQLCGVYPEYSELIERLTVNGF